MFILLLFLFRSFAHALTDVRLKAVVVAHLLCSFAV